MIESAYNERLFSGSGVRSRYHLSRYHWLSREISKIGTALRIVELGCFDAKTLDHIPRPAYYLGLDAGWENGLARGQERFKNDPSIELLQCATPDAIPDRGRFDVGICMETLEHMSYETAERYIERLSRICSRLLITVPNEHGVVFAGKHLVKSLTGNKNYEHYSAKDALMLTLGKTDRVERNEHKGFDYRRLASAASWYFTSVKVIGIFPISIPTLAMTVGILTS